MSGIRFHCKSLWAYDGTVNSHKCCFDKKIGKETKATETIERKEGNNEVCSDEQPLSYHGIAQFTLETENCNFSKSAKWKEWEMNNACSKALVASNTNSDNSVFRSPFQSYWLTFKIPPHDFPAQAPMSNVHWYYGDKYYVRPKQHFVFGLGLGVSLIIKWWYEMTPCPCVWDGEMTPRFLLSPWRENTRGGCLSLWYYVQPAKLVFSLFSLIILYWGIEVLYKHGQTYWFSFIQYVKLIYWPRVKTAFRLGGNCNFRHIHGKSGENHPGDDRTLIGRKIPKILPAPKRTPPPPPPKKK